MDKRYHIGILNDAETAEIRQLTLSVLRAATQRMLSRNMIKIGDLWKYQAMLEGAEKELEWAEETLAKKREEASKQVVERLVKEAERSCWNLKK